MKTVSVVLVLAGLYLAGCNRQSENASSPATSENGWPAVRDALLEDYLKAHPAFAVVQGRHEYDGVLPDWSAAGIANEIRRPPIPMVRQQMMGNAGGSLF